MPITILGRAIAAGVELAEIKYSPGLHLPRHAHERAGFCLVVDGTYVEDYKTRGLECRARTVTFSPAGEEHRNVFDDCTVHCLTIDVPHEFLARLDGVPLRDPFEQHGGTLAMLAERLLLETRDADDASPLAIEGLVLEMIATAARSARHRGKARVTPAIRRIREMLQARFAEPLALTDIAEAVERHPVYIASAFRRAYGETIGACVRRLRIDHARRELARGKLTLADIALSSGFADQSHLTRTFHKATGMTPAAYRALIADNRG
jgi:AraC family transcriptional regulator